MVRSILTACLVLLAGVVWAQKPMPEELKVMSFNVRMDSPLDGINQWGLRKEWVAEIVFFNETDIVGMQEVTYPQLVDLQNLLPGYDYIGEGREGDTKGEFSPIFYLKSRFKVLESGTFWLSESPQEKNSKSWDSSLPRIVTWAKFEDLESKQVFYHFNTHFDHRGKQAREKSVAVIEQYIDQLVMGETVVLTGDLNLPPNDTPYQKIIELGFADTRDQAMYRAEMGHTFNAWDIQAAKRHRIDYVFVKGNALAPLKYQELDIQRGPRFASDHYPVLTTFRWVSQIAVEAKGVEAVRVVNYNVHHFAAANDRYHWIDLNSLSAFAKQHQVDVLTLQEIDVHTKRSGEHLNQVRALAQRLDMYYSFGRTIDYEGGQYGIAILSKFPIASEHFYRLPKGELKEEARGLLVNEIVLPEGRLVIGTTHLASNSNKSRTLQAKAITEIQQSQPMMLLTGDFNAEEGSEPLKVLAKEFSFDSRVADQLTIPVVNSKKKIDFIVKSKESHLSIEKHHTHALNGLSDHNLIITDVTF
ncbi:endonuclease/exonuclease/phosphatase family protein [Myroides pelagicus]|uniref:endonuclease/exonuclease/phosphatase family protein n=1 Tax=Myroides pelagicus TaxID=270914 RepID=UPI002DBD2E2E|nr:endonuclease/exonuclease/phosphatase family protein [Myroides pelagicus]MEC4113444.1 endonuclease/exonuclease/phosphatase family protein [Myroides pelagicus]